VGGHVGQPVGVGHVVFRPGGPTADAGGNGPAPLCKTARMPRRLMQPADVRFTRWPRDPQLSSDGQRAAWCESALDLDGDEPVSNIMVAAVDGAGEPRHFTDGPHDSSPRWSPKGQYLAYISASSGPPAVHLAPLDGGAPRKVEAPGAVNWAEWSPAGDQLVIVVNLTTKRGAPDDPRTRNAARVVRGLFNRFDGQGWFEGRNHLFVYDVNEGKFRQLTSGDYDEAQPRWSWDGSRIVFVSDRSRRRDDRYGWGGIWSVAATGGRPQQLVNGIGNAQFPAFSPDGDHIAFTGVLGPKQIAGRDTRIFVVRSDGKGDPERLAPDLDRPIGFALYGNPMAWLSPEELVFTVVDRGTIGVRRARLGERSARAIVEGDTQVSGLGVAGRGNAHVLTYASGWADSPPEVFCLSLAGRKSQAVQVSRAGNELRSTAELLPTERVYVRAPDGLEIEYFVMRPKLAGLKRPAKKAPLFLEIHGGPHLFNPLSELFTYYQSLAAAGYLVLLPNPRGSIGYGEEFSHSLRGRWGEADFEDLMACADDAINRGMVDPQRQFVGGYSYGGFMSATVIGQTARFKAAAIGAPVINNVSMFGTSDASVLFSDPWGADPWSPPAALVKQSPLSSAPKVNTPVFLYVNDGDLRCPPSQADEYYVALKWLGKAVEYVRFPNGSHLSFFPMIGPPSQSEDRLTRMLEFLQRHGGTPARGTAQPTG
jgi:dipeptidyl aminopeptidase/acylaminoacyl peptidase